MSLMGYRDGCLSLGKRFYQTKGINSDDLLISSGIFCQGCGICLACSFFVNLGDKDLLGGFRTIKQYFFWTNNDFCLDYCGKRKH
ncbi:hypothetical protein EBX93_02270 [bacterium]|nr:hypothetical protein [bacterium]